jgi:RNA recognition motif-containing protein
LLQQINPCQIVDQVTMALLRAQFTLAGADWILALSQVSKESRMKIYVGNLSPETTEVQLRESFVKFGEVASLSIVTDRESGKSRGFAFVEMSSDEHAKAAISSLHGQNLGGSVLKVNEAKKK